MFFLGIFIGNLNTFLVITAPADLGRAQKSKRAIATITGIVDGLGNAGSGIGQLVLGWSITNYGWTYGYLLPISVSISITIIPLSIIFYQELQEIKSLRQTETNQIHQ